MKYKIYVYNVITTAMIASMWAASFLPPTLMSPAHMMVKKMEPKHQHKN